MARSEWMGLRCEENGDGISTDSCAAERSVRPFGDAAHLPLIPDAADAGGWRLSAERRRGHDRSLDIRNCGDDVGSHCVSAPPRSSVIAELTPSGSWARFRLLSAYETVDPERSARWRGDGPPDVGPSRPSSCSTFPRWSCGPCRSAPSRRSSSGRIGIYVLPLGLWQWWAIFAPDPIRNTLYLNAEVVDAKGMRYSYEFPRLGDISWWQRFPRYRNCKFTCNMLIDEYKTHRTFTARHAVRQLGLGEAAFPVWVSLYVEIEDLPPPGTGASDPMATPRLNLVDRFQFASMKEVRP